MFDWVYLILSNSLGTINNLDRFLSPESLAHDSSLRDKQSGEERDLSKDTGHDLSSLLQDSPIPEDQALDADLLRKLGQDDTDQRQKIKIHTQVAAIWSKILNDGLKKEAKTELLEKYPRQGCLQLDAPLLNPEVEAVVNNTAKKRDKFLTMDQSLCGATMAAIGSLISDIIIGKDDSLDWMEVVQRLSDAGRLQCELMYQLSRARRAFIYPGFKKEAKSLLEKIKPDEFLFGTGLADRLKSAKSAEKAGLSMKFASIPKRNPSLTSTTGNWKGPPAKQFYQQAGHRSKFQRNQSRPRPFGNKNPRGPM